MILAAGFGTRLRPLTDRTPKALVDVGGVTMLERTARRLIDAGADRLIINIHHHADQVRRFVEEKAGFGVEVRLSEEPGAPLETGGGLAHASRHFRRDAPFFLHNVDIITGIDLAALARAHADAGPLATLAVSARESTRLLRFDDAGLQARVDARAGRADDVRPAAGATRDVAFAGVHVISPEIFDLLSERGAFSIMTSYFRLAADGRRILPWDMGDAAWLEIGDPDRLRRAREEVATWPAEGVG